MLARTLVVTLAVALLGLASVDNRNVPTGEGDAIFAVDESGALEPIALRRHGRFMDPGSNENAGSDKLRSEANAAIAINGNRVHVIAGGRTVATVPATVEDGAARITVPPGLHLGANVDALASPTLTAHARTARRAATPAERAIVVQLGAAALHRPANALQLRRLTVADLGDGPALIATIFANGTSATKDGHLFIVAERSGGAYRTTLARVMTTAHNPELAGVGEGLIDSIDLGDGKPALVTREYGYDATTFAIYARTKTGFTKIYEGGGIAA